MSSHLVSRGVAEDSRQTSGNDTIVLIDDRPLRRAFIVKFLEQNIDAALVAGATPQDVQRQLNIRSAPPAPYPVSDVADENEGGPTVSLVLLCFGGEGLAADGEAGQVIASCVQKFAGAPVVVISDLETRADILAALRLGVQGFIPTSMNEQVMLATVQLVLAGGQYAPTALLLTGEEEGGGGGSPPTKSACESAASEAVLGRDFADEFDEEDEEDLEPLEEVQLSRRESEVLSHIRHGFQNKQIAYELGMSESTVKVHVRNIMKKLEVTNRTQAAFRARHLALPPLALRDEQISRHAHHPISAAE